MTEVPPHMLGEVPETQVVASETVRWRRRTGRAGGGRDLDLIFDIMLRSFVRDDPRQEYRISIHDPFQTCADAYLGTAVIVHTNHDDRWTLSLFSNYTRRGGDPAVHERRQRRYAGLGRAVLARLARYLVDTGRSARETRVRVRPEPFGSVLRMPGALAAFYERLGFMPLSPVFMDAALGHLADQNQFKPIQEFEF